MSAWTISMNRPFLFHKNISQLERALACSYVIMHNHRIKQIKLDAEGGGGGRER